MLYCIIFGILHLLFWISSKLKTPIILPFYPDATTYAHYLFNAFDTANNGSIKFEVDRHTFWSLLHIYMYVNCLWLKLYYMVSVRSLWWVCPFSWGDQSKRNWSGLFICMTSIEMDASAKKCITKFHDLWCHKICSMVLNHDWYVNY